MAFDAKTGAQRLRAIGLNPDVAHQLVSLVQKWIKDSGEEWTVDRIKAFKVDLVRHFSGLPPLKSHSWVHYNSEGVPKGAFGAVFRLSKREFAKAWNAIMVYTGLVFDHPELRVTHRQWKKALASIRREPLDPVPLINGIRLIHRDPPVARVRLTETTGSPLWEYQPSPVRRAPKGFRTVPEAEGVLDSVRPLLRRTGWTVENWDILSGTLAGLEGVAEQIELNVQDELRTGSDFLDSDRIPEMGVIALIQEAGYKLRFAANPYRVYQCASEPLGRALFNALRSVPNDFTFDQAAGVAFVQQQLREGLAAASMDLSNATDNAPLDLQLEHLSRCGVPTRWLQFLKSMSRGDWYVSISKKRDAPVERLQWTVGSPLGLYPTFPCFALWHHAVVRSCFRDRERFADHEGILPYAIVGDDVVICDLDVAETYRSRMESWGVPISEHKTLVSPSSAEFLGRVITPNRVYQGFKWKGRVSDDSFVDVCRNIGPGALMLMRPRQRRVLAYIADLPEPYGLGWNPLGIPLEERWTPRLERIWLRDERLRQFSRASARANRLRYESEDYRRPYGRTGSDTWTVPKWDAQASDQEAARVVHELLPGWESWEEAIWPNLLEVAQMRKSDMPPELAEEFRLMLRRTSSLETRKEAPTLVLLERKIRRAVARSL